MRTWHFAVPTDDTIKTEIRKAADQWLQALAPLGPDTTKPFLEMAPVLIGVFLKKFSFSLEGKRLKNYHPYESVGIASTLLISALHQFGLEALTHTPGPMAFLNQYLINQKPKGLIFYWL
jgi:hypothetical protein